MSRIVYAFYKEHKISEITKVIFTHKDSKIKDPLIFVHYFSSEEDISQFKNLMSIEEFELVFSKIASDPVACNKCFVEYLKKNQVTLIEFIIR